MVSLLIWACILWACFGFGAAALRRLRVHADGLAEEAPFAIGLGMGALSYLMLAVGLLGWLKVWVGVAAVAVVGALGWRHALRLPGEIIASLSSARSWRWQAAALAAFFLATFSLSVIGALAPAAGRDYDALVYHLTIPKVYLREGGIHFIPWLSHSNFPFSMEMLYLLGLLLDGQALSKLFHFACGWLTAIAVFAFARRGWGARAGWLGAAIFVAVPVIAWELRCAYNELSFALFGFLTVYALGRWGEGRRGEPSSASSQENGAGWLWLSALMCGMALATKMLAAAVVVFGVLVLLWALVREAARGRALRRAVVFTLIALAVASPWYVKSYLWTGNPVYPFFYQLFDGRYWTLARARDYTAAQKDFGFRAAQRVLGATAARGSLGPPIAPLQFALLPWNLTMNARWYFDVPQSAFESNVRYWLFGPLLLALVPLLPLTGPAGARGRLALWFAVVYAGLWFVLTQNGRYLIPIVPGLSACAGASADRLLSRGRLCGAAAAVVLLLGLCGGLLTHWWLTQPVARVALGLEPQDRYLTASLPIYRMCAYINETTPPTAKILVFGDEPRMFYLDRSFLLGDHSEIVTQADRASPDAFLRKTRALGVTHLLLQGSFLKNVLVRRGGLETAIATLAESGRLRVVGLDSGSGSVLCRVEAGSA